MTHQHAPVETWAQRAVEIPGGHAPIGPASRPASFAPPHPSQPRPIPLSPAPPALRMRTPSAAETVRGERALASGAGTPRAAGASAAPAPAPSPRALGADRPAGAASWEDGAALPGQCALCRGPALRRPGNPAGRGGLESEGRGQRRRPQGRGSVSPESQPLPLLLAGDRDTGLGCTPQALAGARERGG